MSGATRTARSAHNVAVGAGSQVLLVGLSFAVRTVFVAELGVELLGVQALLVSILAVLAVADLGISGAVMFALYGPLASNEPDRVRSIVVYAGRLYRYVAAAVLVAGLAALPFLDRLVNLDEPPPQVSVYYLVLLLNAAVVYLTAHRVILLNADQRMYVVQTYALAFAAARAGVQISSLILFQSFLVFLGVQVVFTIANNLVVYRKAGRLYSYLDEPADSLASDARSSIKRSVRALFVYRVGGIALNSTDAILISVIVGTLALGYYSNYLLVVGSIAMVTEAAFLALSPGVGNLVAAGGRARGEQVLREVALLALTVYGTLAVVLMTLLNDFIELWLGPEFVLEQSVVVAVVANFFLVGMQMPIWAFREGTGVFRETKYVFVLTALLNLGLSMLLGTAYGISGIVAATVVARLVTVVWYEPWVLMRRHLGGSFARYMAWQLGGLALVGLAFVAVELVGRPLGDSILAFGARVAITLTLVPLLIWLVHGRSDEFRRVVARGRLLARSRKNPA